MTYKLNNMYVIKNYYVIKYYNALLYVMINKLSYNDIFSFTNHIQVLIKSYKHLTPGMNMAIERKNNM